MLIYKQLILVNNNPKQIQVICSKIPEFHQKTPIRQGALCHRCSIPNDGIRMIQQLRFPRWPGVKFGFRVFGKELAIVFVPSLALPGVNRMKLQTSKEQRGRFEAYKSQNQNNERGVASFSNWEVYIGNESFLISPKIFLHKMQRVPCNKSTIFPGGSGSWQQETHMQGGPPTYL